MATFYMDLELPTVTVTPGPEWASQLNTALELVDSHDHTDGKGQRLTPLSLNINSDVEFNDNDAVELRSTRFSNQDSVLADLNDIRCLYVSGNDLYYNTEAGVAVQITSGAGLNASSLGAIGGDYGVSSASLYYSNSNKTFVFDQSSGVRANIDVANITIREATSGANGIVLQSPNSLGAGYNLILPTGLPSTGETKFLSIDSSGQIGAVHDVDNTSIDISSNNIRIKPSGVTTDKIADSNVTTAKIADSNVTTAKIADSNVTTAKIADSNVTREKLEDVGEQISSDCDSFTTSSSTFIDVTNCSVTITTTGRPVMVFLKGDPTHLVGNNLSYLASSSGDTQMRILRDSDVIYCTRYAAFSNPSIVHFPPSAFWVLDTPSAGTYTYKFQVKGPGSSFQTLAVQLGAYEL